MKLGDLVTHLDRHWIVNRYDSKRTRLATLLAADGTQMEIPHDLDASGGLVVIANPAEQWPFVVMPEKAGYRLYSIQFRGVFIEEVTGWVASDPTRAGGPVFFAPDTRLRYGEMLLVRYVGVNRRAVSNIRVDIPRDFGTVQQRVAKAAKPKPALVEKNAFTRILDDDLIGDD